MSKSKPPLLLIVKAHIQAQPRKCAILCVLFLFMIGMYARLYIPFSGPSVAMAEDHGAPRPLPVSAQAVVPMETFKRVPVDRVATDTLARDPFVLDLKYYPKRVPLAYDPDGGPEGVGHEVQEDAQQMQVQSIIYQPDGTGLACIGGAMVRVGDEVNGFQVVKVGATRVWLERGKVRYVLSLP